MLKIEFNKVYEVKLQGHTMIAALQALGQLPHNQVAEIIGEIMKQLHEQISVQDGGLVVYRQSAKAN